MIRKIEVERFTLTSSKPFDEVLAAINAAIGHPDMAQFWKSTQQTLTAAKLESTIQRALGKTGLMSFVQFDHGHIIGKATGRDAQGSQSRPGPLLPVPTRPINGSSPMRRGWLKIVKSALLTVS